MLRRLEYLKRCWNYYLTLENRFSSTVSYVEIDSQNNKTFSDEYASLIITVCAEADVMFKMACGYKPSDRNRNIKDYKFNLGDTISQLSVKVLDNRILPFKPFYEWGISHQSTSLFWWRAYNDIKHNRIEHRKDATQTNIIYALGGLFVLENLMMKKIADRFNCIFGPDRHSNLFEIEDWNYDTGRSDNLLDRNEIHALEKSLGILSLPEE